MGSNRDEYECWGTFVYWCKSGALAASSSNTSIHYQGLSCKGHFKYIAGDEPSDTKLLVCEGGFKFIAGKVATCPYLQKTFNSMYGTWALGTSISAMNVTKDSDEPEPEPQQSILSRAASHAFLQASAVARRAAASPGPVRLPMTAVLQRMVAARALALGPINYQTPPGGSALLAAAAARAGGVGSSGAAHSEDRHDGISGEIRLVVEVKPEQEAAIEGDAAAALMEEVLQPSLASFLAGAGPVAGSGGPAGPSAPRMACKHDTQYSLTCNGRPAWGYGALPCWGTLQFSMEGGSSDDGGDDDDDDDDSNDGAHGAAAAAAAAAAAHGPGAAGAGISAARRLLAAGGVSLGPGRTPQPAAGTVGHHGPSAWSVKAECRGLFTGILGHACFGLNRAHVTARWNESGSFEKYSICAGRQGMKRIHTKMAHGDVSMCKGKAVHAVDVAWGRASDAGVPQTDLQLAAGSRMGWPDVRSGAAALDRAGRAADVFPGAPSVELPPGLAAAVRGALKGLA